MKEKILFIVNPFSGVGKHKIIDQKVEKLLDKDKYIPTISYTERPGHAIELSKNAVEQGFDIIVAVGGDGSINEVMQSIVGTTTKLGIVPAGSGNGLAMHLKIGRDIDRAIQILNKGKCIKIDTCTINEIPFINLAGVGFDAHIAYHIKKSKFRGLKGYMWQTLIHAGSYKLPLLDIEIDGRKFRKKCLVIEVANAPMFGYNFEVAPTAKLDDGLLEVVLIKNAPKWRYMLSFWRFLNGSVLKSRLTEHYTAKEVKISSEETLAVHYDGEGHLTNKTIHIGILPKSISVIVPEVYSAISP